MKVSRLFWIGMIFVISSIAFIGGLMYLQEITFRKSNYTFTVLFDNVQGLNVGDQVDMLGKKIGKVSSNLPTINSPPVISGTEPKLE